MRCSTVGPFFCFKSKMAPKAEIRLKFVSRGRRREGYARGMPGKQQLRADSLKLGSNGSGSRSCWGQRFRRGLLDKPSRLSTTHRFPTSPFQRTLPQRGLQLGTLHGASLKLPPTNTDQARSTTSQVCWHLSFFYIKNRTVVFQIHRRMPPQFMCLSNN